MMRQGKRKSSDGTKSKQYIFDLKTIARMFELPYNTLRDNYMRVKTGHHPIKKKREASLDTKSVKNSVDYNVEKPSVQSNSTFPYNTVSPVQNDDQQLSRRNLVSFVNPLSLFLNKFYCRLIYQILRHFIFHQIL